MIATGARPRTLAFPGADLLTTSDQFLDLEELPYEIAFVGGGYTSLVARSRSMGIEIVLRSEVEEVARKGNQLVVRTNEGETNADLVVHAAGRVPDIDDLDLEAAGVESEERASGYKVLTEPSSGKILGAHLLGWNAEEVINHFGFAIRHAIPADDLRAMLTAYPSHASDIGYMVAR